MLGSKFTTLTCIDSRSEMGIYGGLETITSNFRSANPGRCASASSFINSTPSCRRSSLRRAIGNINCRNTRSTKSISQSKSYTATSGTHVQYSRALYICSLFYNPRNQLFGFRTGNQHTLSNLYIQAAKLAMANHILNRTTLRKFFDFTL